MSGKFQLVVAAKMSVVATLSFGRCLGAAEVACLGLWPRLTWRSSTMAESSEAVLETGAAFDVVVGEFVVTCVLPALPTEEKA